MSNTITKRPELIDVRCPFKRRKSFSSDLVLCNQVCVRVYPNSSGETRCSRCKLTFEFQVNHQEDVDRKVRVKSK